MSRPASQVILAPLAGWFSANRRDLPWRALDLGKPHPDPYAVLVSELMLQQTQVATVVPYFRRWMERFPDPQSLAAAADDEVHKLWEGLGYYRRARFLKQAAAQIARNGWPTDLESLQALPGLGPYTAAAVASIAFQWPEPALDGNAFRVLARLLAIEDDPRSHVAALKEWLRPALAAFGPSRVTQAVMELGATLCAPKAACGACPLKATCGACQAGLVDRIPPPAARPVVKRLEAFLLAISAEGHWLMLEPSRRGLLAGLWRWPMVEATNSSDLAAETAVPYGACEIRTWAGWTQVYSHRREVVTPVALTLPVPFPPPSGHVWVRGEELGRLPLGKRDQRLRGLLPLEASSVSSGIPVGWLLQKVAAGSSLEKGSEPEIG